MPNNLIFIDSLISNANKDFNDYLKHIKNNAWMTADLNNEKNQELIKGVVVTGIIAELLEKEKNDNQTCLRRIINKPASFTLDFSQVSFKKLIEWYNCIHKADIESKQKQKLLNNLINVFNYFNDHDFKCNLHVLSAFYDYADLSSSFYVSQSL